MQMRAGIMPFISVTMRQLWLRTRISESLLETEKTDHTRLYLRARALARSGAFELSVPLYERALELEPTLGEALEGLGEALDVLGKTDLALEKYAAARRVRAEARLGPPDRHFVLRQRGHFTAEVLAYDSVVRSLKKNTLPYIARGNAYLASGRPKEALENYDYALKLKRKLPDVLVLKGEALTMLGRCKEAIRQFDIAVKARPENAEALGGRAIARLGAGLLGKANADWQRQFALLKGRPSARACVALRLADYASALPELELALEKEPNDPYWHLYRLTARRRLGLSADIGNLPSNDAWPGLLLGLHVGNTTLDEVLKRADTDNRRAEAAFQLGVLAVDRSNAASRRYWTDAIGQSSPSLIEHAAARNELARLGVA